MKKLLMVIAAALLVVMNVRLWARTGVVPVRTTAPVRASAPARISSATTYKDLQADFDRLVTAFKKSSAYTESNVQLLINLVSLESVIADSLYRRAGAYQIEQLVAEREMYLRQAVPSVHQLYNQMVDLATYSETLNTRVGHARGDWKVRLGVLEDREFLINTRNRLNDYLGTLSSTQCALSAAHNLGHYVSIDNAVAVEDGDQVVQFCPIKL